MTAGGAGRGGAQKVLVCGWGEPTFMSNLLRELDHGPAALPRGSEVVLFNQQETEQQQEMLSVRPASALPPPLPTTTITAAATTTATATTAILEPSKALYSYSFLAAFPKTLSGGGTLF